MVTLYSTLTCPKCKILREKMELKGIEYTDVHDLDVLVKRGFDNVPVLEVGSDMLDFAAANSWINSQDFADER